MASVVVTMDSREAKLFQAMDKLIQKQTQVNAKFKEGGKVSEDAGRKSKDSWDKSQLSVAKATAAIGSYVSGLATITVGVGLIKAAWDQVNKSQEAGLSQLQKVADADRRLRQVSSPEQMAERRQLADELSADTGFDRARTRAVIFSGVSESFQDIVPELIKGWQVVNPESAAGVAGQLPALFKGAIGALEAVDLTLKAAETSRLDFEDIAKAMPQAAEGGGVAKATAEETLAVLSVLASEFKSGDTAADRLKMFATRAGISEQFAGQGFVGPLEKLMAMDEASRRKYLGDSQELNVAYIKLSENIDLIKQRIVEIGEERKAFAEGRGMYQQKTLDTLVNPIDMAVRSEAMARQALEAAQAEVSGIAGGAGGAAALKAQEIILREGSFGAKLFSGIGSQAARLSTNAGVAPERAAEIGAEVSQRLGNFVPGVGIYELIHSMRQSADAMKASSKELSSAAGSLRSNTGAARAQAAGANP